MIDVTAYITSTPRTTEQITALIYGPDYTPDQWWQVAGNVEAAVRKFREDNEGLTRKQRRDPNRSCAWRYVYHRGYAAHYAEGAWWFYRVKPKVADNRQKEG